MRELASSTVEEVQVADICRHIPVSEDDKIQLCKHLKGVPAMQAAHASTWLCNVTSELNSTTWMGLANDHEPPILTKRGTRPGSAFADITFGVMLKRILDFREVLKAEASVSSRPAFTWDGVKSFQQTPDARGKRQMTLHRVCSVRMRSVLGLPWASKQAAWLMLLRSMAWWGVWSSKKGSRLCDKGARFESGQAWFVRWLRWPCSMRVDCAEGQLYARQATFGASL